MSRPIFMQASEYLPVHFQTASVCSATPRYAAASRRVSNSKRAGLFPKGMFEFIGLYLYKCSQQVAATLMKSRAARVARVKMFVEKEKAQTINMI